MAIVRDKAIFCADTGEICDDYHKYLESLHWQQLRVRYISSRDFNCFACGEHKAGMNLHHLTYRRIGDEWLDDLIPLCFSCHRLAHFIRVLYPKTVFSDLHIAAQAMAKKHRIGLPPVTGVDDAELERRGLELVRAINASEHLVVGKDLQAHKSLMAWSKRDRTKSRWSTPSQKPVLPLRPKK